MRTKYAQMIKDFSELGLTLSDKQLEQFDTYFNMAMTYYYTENDLDNCLECINKINITSIEDEEHYRQLITMKCYCLSLKKEYFSAYKILDNYHHFGEITNSLKGYKAYIAYKLGKFEEKLISIEKKQDKHNSVVERTYLLESRTDVQEEQIKVINHRIEDLEKDFK